MVELRDALTDDGAFLAKMLAYAADWRPGASVRSADEALRDPNIAHYVVDWPQPGDCGVVALDSVPVGAAWFRFLSAADPGYGYVSDDIPEVTIAVETRYRGQGVGRAMLTRLVERADEAGVLSLSLSVEEDNPALRLYEQLMFAVVNRAGGAATMLRQIGS